MWFGIIEWGKVWKVIWGYKHAETEHTLVEGNYNS